MKDILKKINKKEKVIIGITLGVIVITLISVIVKDTHAYYSDKTEISLFNAKIGNFKPVINTFYIKDTNTPKYTNQNINTVYLSWGNNNKNINEMCITEGDINSCSWQAINTSTQYTFATETEGPKVVKGYIKDKAGNKSLEKSDTIIYDKTAPTINKVEATTTTENSITVNVTANQDLSGVTEYCYATSQTGPYTCKSESTNQYTGLDSGKEYTFWIYLKDKAGNGVQGDATQHKFQTEDKPKTPLEMLTEKGKNTFTLKNGMYRFVGTKDEVTNNYICFGTDDKKTCLGTPGTYMYRIIGLTSEDDNIINLPAKSLKLIKAIPSSGLRQWDSSYSSDVKWDASAMKTYLNGTFYNSIKDAKPNGAYWDSIILSHSWYNADYTSVPATEPTTSHTTASKIGLMYVTDYKNAGSQNTNDWLFIKNGWSTNSSLSGNALYEWTLSRYGYSRYGYYGAWYVGTSGGLSDSTLDSARAVRPVFYLQSGVSLVGTGSTEDPFRIAA